MERGSPVRTELALGIGRRHERAKSEGRTSPDAWFLAKQERRARPSSRPSRVTRQRALPRDSERAVLARLALPFVANHASRVEPADACFRDCIGAAWQPLTVAPMLRPRRATCVRRRLLPVIRAKVGKHWIARPRLMLCLCKQRCSTSTPTSSCTDSRTAPAMSGLAPDDETSAGRPKQLRNQRR
jgi:hypothetical protein